MKKLKKIFALYLLLLAVPLYAEALKSPTEIAKDYFNQNKGDPKLQCKNITKIIVKQNLKNTKDYLVVCSDKESYRIVKEHTSFWLGKHSDKWITHGFKCSDLAGTTIEGWQDPKKWNITSKNCSSH